MIGNIVAGAAIKRLFRKEGKIVRFLTGMLIDTVKSAVKPGQVFGNDIKNEVVSESGEMITKTDKTRATGIAIGYALIVFIVVSVMEHFGFIEPGTGMALFETILETLLAEEPAG